MAKYETHVTVNGGLELADELKAVCAELGQSVQCHELLKVNEVQLMATSHVEGSMNQSISALLETAARLEAKGFVIARSKLEQELPGPDNADSLVPGEYYEAHFKIPATNTATLMMCYLSRNLLKPGAPLIATRRDYESPLSIFNPSVNSLCSEIGSKPIFEKVVYDSNVELDAAWEAA